MTKKRKADLLLRAAKRWQNRDLASDSMGRLPECVCDMLDAMPDEDGLFTTCPSAALSEVAALGFDIEDVLP